MVGIRFNRHPCSQYLSTLNRAMITTAFKAIHFRTASRTYFSEKISLGPVMDPQSTCPYLLDPSAWIFCLAGGVPDADGVDRKANQSTATDSLGRPQSDTQGNDLRNACASQFENSPGKFSTQ